MTVSSYLTILTNVYEHVCRTRMLTNCSLQTSTGELNSDYSQQSASAQSWILKAFEKQDRKGFAPEPAISACDWWCWLGFKSRPNPRLSQGSSQIWARFEYHDGYLESGPITLFWQTKEGNKVWVMRDREISAPNPSCCSAAVLQSLTCFAAVSSIPNPSSAHQTLVLPFVKPSENKTLSALVRASGGECISDRHRAS